MLKTIVTSALSSKILLLLALLATTGCGLASNLDLLEKQEAQDAPQKVMPPKLEAQCNKLYRLNARGKRTSWKGAIPVLFAFDSSFPVDFIPAVKSAMDTWNRAAGIEIFRVVAPRVETSLPSTEDGQNTIYFLDKTSKSEPLRIATEKLFKDDGVLAATQGALLGNRIVDSDIVFNGVARDFTTMRLHITTGDVESTALHELGHALGLIHSDDPLSMMFFAEWSPLAFRELDSTSKEILACEYETSN